MMALEEKNLDYYLKAFAKMKRAPMRGYHAPHKLILLLSVIRLIKDGAIVSQEIELSDSLINCFKMLWEKYIDAGGGRQTVMVAEGLDIELSNTYPFSCSIENSFYYMSSEPFWTLRKSADYVNRSSYSLSGLRKSFTNAVIDQELFALMQDVDSRQVMEDFLIDAIE